MSSSEAESFDLFDEVLNLEEKYTISGWEDGFREGRTKAHAEGVDEGRKQGALIGRELGAIRGVVGTFLEVSVTIEKAFVPVSKRELGLLQKLASLIDVFDLSNPDRDTFQAEYDRIHANFRVWRVLRAQSIESSTTQTTSLDF